MYNIVNLYIVVINILLKTILLYIKSIYIIIEESEKKMYKLRKILVTITLVILIITYIQNLVFAAESELTLTPKPETNNIHLKWTGPQNSSYKVYQKKPGSSNFETIGLTDFSNNATDEEVKVLNIYPSSNELVSIPNVHVVYKDGQVEDIPKSALLKVWMEGRNSYRRIKCDKL